VRRFGSGGGACLTVTPSVGAGSSGKELGWAAARPAAASTDASPLTQQNLMAILFDRLP
jgi:hypothetical protein